MEVVRLRGIGVSPGIGMGEVFLPERVVFTSRVEAILPSQVDAELQRLRKAVAKTRQELLQLKAKIEEKLSEEHAFIFDAHLLILEDKTLRAGIEKIIAEEKIRAEGAISQVNVRYQSVFEAISDEYFRQRKFDVSDVLAKIYRNLEVKEVKEVDDTQNIILVAHDLLPSEAALRLSRGNILAVALDMGGQTSHTAILARSLNIPTVVGLRNITGRVKSKDFVIVDGTDGEVIVNPPAAVVKEFGSKKERYDSYRSELQKTAQLSPLTLDSVRFCPLANIELP
jgi:phosphotransferase system enzyme I (PtsI)